MSTLGPILDDVRKLIAAAGDDAQKINAIVMAVAEAATLLDDELEKTVANMKTLPISHPLIAANHDVRTLLWHNAGRQLVRGVANEQRPIVALPIVPAGHHHEYHAEVDRLAAVVREVLQRRL